MIEHIMNHDQHKQLELAEKYIESGNYKKAKTIAKQLRSQKDTLPLSEEDTAKIDEMLQITGFDPVIIGAFAVTLGTIVYLYFKYAF